MKQFAGLEPLVGEIVGLRTFRVDESGLLLPLYSNRAWYDGPNTATCAPPTGEPERWDHPVPAPDCECGFYAYGTAEAAEHNPGTRYVEAVVSCWGRVVAGTQGVRAEHARIDALWLNSRVSPLLRRRVAATYPSARLFSDRAAMLAEFPLSQLPCYEPPPRRSLLGRIGVMIAGLALLGLGLVPTSILHAQPMLWDSWLVITALVATVTAWLLVAARGVGHLAAAAVSAGVLGWLAAPVLGPTGWLLRLPLLRGVLVAGGGYLLRLRPGYFPVVHTVRERAFCGVRP